MSTTCAKHTETKCKWQVRGPCYTERKYWGGNADRPSHLHVEEAFGADAPHDHAGAVHAPRGRLDPCRLRNLPGHRLLCDILYAPEHVKAFGAVLPVPASEEKHAARGELVRIGRRQARVGAVPWRRPCAVCLRPPLALSVKLPDILWYRGNVALKCHCYKDPALPTIQRHMSETNRTIYLRKGARTNQVEQGKSR